MQITLETIYQQLLDTKTELKDEMKADKAELKADNAELKAEMQADKAEIKAGNAELKAEIGSVKTWFVGLSLSTILVVTALMTTFLNMN